MPPPEVAHIVALMGGPNAGKTHPVTAVGMAGITHLGRRVRTCSTVEWSVIEQAGRIALSLPRMDLVILDKLGCLRFSQACGALLLYLLSKLCERTREMITTNLGLAE